MAVVRWNPWQELNSLQHQLNQLFEEDMLPSTVLEKSLTRFPAAELRETAEAIYLNLEIPGIAAKDVDLQVTEKAVYISGERKSEAKTDEKGVVRSEFQYGKFQRVIPLPVRIQNTNVKAEYKDGILHLTLPKAETEKNKVVKINLESVG